MNEFYNIKKIYWIDELKIPEYSFILLAWKRKSGKWVLCKNLLKKICDDFEIDSIIIFWKTSKFTKEYDFVDKQYVYDYDESTESKLKKIMKYQENKIKNKKQSNIILVFDDITLYKKNFEIMN